MLTDKGFSHALAKEVLKDDPTNKAALKILTTTPKHRIVVGGVTYDGNEVDENKLRKERISKFVNRVKERN